MAPKADRYSVEQVALALKETRGMVYLAARRLECTPQTVFKYLKRYPRLSAEADKARGELLDTAELKLMEQVRQGNWKAIAYTLDRLGTDRGYIVKQKTEVGGEVVHTHIQAWQERLQQAHQALAAARGKVIEGNFRRLPAGEDTDAPSAS